MVCHNSILGPLLFLIYINNMPQAVDTKLLLYASDSFQHKDIKIEEHQKQDPSTSVDCFVDNKLSVHL